MSNDRRALIVLDVINELVHPDGKFAAWGYPEQVAKHKVLENTAAALAKARAANIPVLFVTVGFAPDYADWTPTSPLLGDAKKYEALGLGTWATEIHESVRPEAGEPVIVKHRISPFHNTDLELQLRTRGIDTLLLAGVSTDLVVLSAAREGHDRDFRIEVLEDATAAATAEDRAAALRILAHTAKITTVAQAFGA
ncbi:cysteine hydrolase family protein [Streptomyces monticola]|uniref:Cysteine hydrolase family protein n=1 Tax=Streptomyces monticola TaxID=2666263 RepID=A0ABW2JU90_9ACTN